MYQSSLFITVNFSKEPFFYFIKNKEASMKSLTCTSTIYLPQQVDPHQPKDSDFIKFTIILLTSCEPVPCGTTETKPKIINQCLSQFTSNKYYQAGSKKTENAETTMVFAL